MILHRRKFAAVIVLLVSFSQIISPVLADSSPPRIDWKEFQDLLGNDPENDVGEQMC